MTPSWVKSKSSAHPFVEFHQLSQFFNFSSYLFLTVQFWRNITSFLCVFESSRSSLVMLLQSCPLDRMLVSML